MSIAIANTAEGIFTQTWTGYISGDDLLNAQANQTLMMEQLQFEHLITIIDASEATGIEINIRVLRDISGHESRELAIYIVNPPKIGGMLVRVVSQLIPNKEIRICTSLQEAQQLADAQLKKAKASHT